MTTATTGVGHDQAAAGYGGGRDKSRIELETGMGRDEFLKLLVTQLRYQDPLDALDGREFIAELAQFASLERLNQVADGFEALAGSIADLTGGNRQIQALGLIGRTVHLESGLSGRVVRVAFDRGQVLLGLAGGKWATLDEIVEIADTDVLEDTEGIEDGEDTGDSEATS